MKKKHSFIDRLMSSIERKRSHVVVGLDPDIEKIPKYLNKKATSRFGSGLKGLGWAIREFGRRVVDEVADVVPAVKPQIAFYESYGVYGLKALADTVRYARKKDLLVILDAKRNDIGSTAKAYSAAYLGRSPNHRGKRLRVFDFDGITLNPYLGSDGIFPFIDDAKEFGKGLFVLVKTSNTSSNEIQDLVVDTGLKKKHRLYEAVGELVAKWGADHIEERGYSLVGAVVGATFPKEARILRKLMPHSYFLVPGYGAQGAGPMDVVDCFNADGFGALVASSRSIIYAHLDANDPEADSTERAFSRHVKRSARIMIDDINEALSSRGKLAW